MLRAEPLHGYAIAQRIHQLSREELQVEEGSRGRKQLELELADFRRTTRAIELLIESA